MKQKSEVCYELKGEKRTKVLPLAKQNMEIVTSGQAVRSLLWAPSFQISCVWHIITVMSRWLNLLWHFVPVGVARQRKFGLQPWKTDLENNMVAILALIPAHLSFTLLGMSVFYAVMTLGPALPLWCSDSALFSLAFHAALPNAHEYI